MADAQAANLITTRGALQRVGVHILARRRAAVAGRIGLRAVPGGIGTPAFGPDVEVLRVVGTSLVRERGGATEAIALTTLAEAARFAEVDLAAPHDVGHDTPPVGDPDARLDIDTAAADRIFDWYGRGARVLDQLVTALPAWSTPSAIQLWPEHFDLACDVAWGPGDGQRVNLGFSPGDDHLPEPYAYVGPWDHVPTDDDPFWNAPFGATRTAANLHDEAAARAFMRDALGRLAETSPGAEARGSSVPGR